VATDTRRELVAGNPGEAGNGLERRGYPVTEIRAPGRDRDPTP